MARTKAEQAAIERDGPRCLRCLRSLHNFPASVHHRLPRSGGTKAEVDRVDNLTVLCGSGTTQGSCHAWCHNSPEAARRTGWVIRRFSRDEPYQIPLTDLYGNTFTLTEEGDVTPVTREVVA